MKRFFILIDTRTIDDEQPKYNVWDNQQKKWFKEYIDGFHGFYNYQLVKTIYMRLVHGSL